MNKTLEVIRFEVMRNLKKPSFWIAAILIPIGFALYIGFAALVGYNAGESMEAGTNTTELKLGVYDEAKYLSGTKFINADEKEQEVAIIESKDAGVNAVKAKELDVFYYISKDFATDQKVEIYTKPEAASITDDYSMPIRSLLSMTAAANVNPIDLAVVTGAVNFNTTAFSAEDDHVIDQDEILKAIIGPVIALVCFYILLVVLGNRLTTAMVEEKENRISELLLTSIKPINLIVGKIISLMIVGIVQLIVLIVPVLVLYKVGLANNILPADLAISFDLASIAMYMLLLIMSYFLFTAMSVIVGVISPTAKDANSYSGVMIIMVIMPIFFVNAFMPNGIGTLTYVLSYFPPSAPIALMLRGLFGNLPTWEFWLGLADITIFGLLASKLATHIFCRNAIEFTPKINFKKLFGSPRKQWKK
ncbi:MAG: ABC transporter permease [Candidatus Saccharibacteria bacterium]|nr:ABC transporter permease [Candidatus Saccharibacteria bacterium]